MNQREFWVKALERVARPVLEAGAAGKLRERMALQQPPDGGRSEFSYFECVGRLLCGIGPWLDSPLPNGPEKALQQELRELAWKTLQGQVDPASPDYADFEETCRLRSQILVDAAFLAQGILRAPGALWEALPPDVQGQLAKGVRLTRQVAPWFNNWLLFSAEVEAWLNRMAGEYDPMRVDYAIRQHQQWYIGDGLYQDGVSFAMDYYNSFVIQPMLLDVTAAFPELAGPEIRRQTILRAQRYGGLLERMISPDGTYPVIGRSVSYRCGAFHLLAQLALEHLLPEGLSPAQVRCALTAVIARTLGDASFREDGFLQIGLCGNQPSLGEGYISTGSLYLCAAVFLPLGLGPEDPFWDREDEPFTQQRIWRGEDVPADHKL